MTTSLAYLLFEDENLKTNKPLPETSSDDFVINNALLKSLRNTLNDKLIAKLPEARKVKEAIDSLQTKDDMSDAEKSNLINDIKPVINDPIGAFSKGDLIRLSNTAQNISRIGPVVFDVAQVKTGKSQIKGFTGIDLELMKQSQIIPLMVMTKEGKVLSGDNTSKGEFGIIFLAPAYYAKINPENVPIYQELFPGILSEIEEGGETIQIASNNIDNVELPAAPFNSDTEKFIQNAFKNRKTLPALINRLETAYRSTKQNIDFDVSDDVSKADQQAIDLQAAGVFENSSMICKQGISSLILENDASESDRLSIVKNGRNLHNAVISSNLALIKDEFFKFNRNLYKKEVYLLPKNFVDLFHLVFKMEHSLFQNYMIAYSFGFNDLMSFGFYDENLNNKLKENINLAFEVGSLFEEKFNVAQQAGGDVTEDMFTDDEKAKASRFADHFNENIATHFSRIFTTDDKRLVIELLEKAMNVPDKRGWKDVLRAGGSEDVAKLFKKLESYNEDDLGPEFIQFLMYAIKNNKKIKLEAKVHKNRIISEAANFPFGTGIIRSIWRHLSDIGLDKFADQIRRAMFWNVVDEKAVEKFENKLQDIDAQIQDQEQEEQGEDQGEDQEEQGEDQDQGEGAQGEQGEEKKEVDYKDFDDKFNTELDKALSKAKLEIEKYDDAQKEKEIKSGNPRLAEIRNWLRFAGQKDKSDAIYDRLTEIDPELAEGIRGVNRGRLTTKEKFFDDVGEILLVNIAALYDLIVKELKIEIPPDDSFLNTIERYSQLQNLIDRGGYVGEEKNNFEGLVKRDLEALFSKDSNFLFTDQVVNNIDDGETKKIFLSKTKEVRDKFVNLYTRSLNTSTQSVTIKSIQETPPYIVYLAKKLDMSPRKIFNDYLQKEHPQTISMLMSCIQPVFGLEKAYNSFIMGYYDLPVETRVEVAVRYASLDVVNTDALQDSIIAMAKDIAEKNKLNVEITKEELDKFGEDCKVIYGVPVEEEEVRDEHINDICEYMQRKIIQESDRERYEKAVAKAAADFKAKQTTRSNIEMAGFSLGGLASLALGASAGIATGGIGAVVPLIAGIIGCPIAAVGAGVTTELVAQLTRGKPKQKEVTQSELSGLIERKAKQSSNTLKRIILNQVKAATVVENAYVHLKNNSLAQLIFEEADFDFTDSGTDVKKSSTKKRQIERKSLEAMFEQKKFLVYDKSLEETNLDILGLKNEFIESLNSILDYYYNTTIVGVVSKKSAHETIRSIKIDNALSEKVEAIGQEEVTKSLAKTTIESVRDANPEASGDEVRNNASNVLDQIFEAMPANPLIKQKDVEKSLQKLSFEKLSSEENPATQFTSSDDSLGVSAESSEDKTIFDLDHFKNLSVKTKEFNILFKDENIQLVNLDMPKLKRYKDSQEIQLMPVFITLKNRLCLVGYFYKDKIVYIDKENVVKKIESVSLDESLISKIRNNLKLSKDIKLVSATHKEYTDDSKVAYAEIINKFFKSFINFSNATKQALLLGLYNNENNNYIFESKANKKLNGYMLGSLTNLLFESDLKRSKDFYNKSKNKKQELSNLREEWLNIWDIYK